MKQFNCPNCAAPITSDTCPYCGAVFLDFAAIQLNKPSYVKIIDDNNNIILMKLIMDELQIRMNSDIIDTIGKYNKVLSTTSKRSLEIDMSAHAVALNDGSLMIAIRKENE